MSLRSWVAVLAGLGLATLLLAQTGLSAVGDAVLAAGWRGLLAVAALHVLAQLVCAVAWWLLWPPGSSRTGAGRPTCTRLMGVRLVRDAMGEILPTVPIGELAAARELMRAGLDVVEASAFTVADVTVELGVQVGFCLAALGLVTLAGLGGWRVLELSGLASSVFIFGGCVWVQRSGGGQLVRLCGGALPLLRGVPHVWDRVHAALRRIYARHGAVAFAATAHLTAWFIGGLQSWMVLRIMGVPVTLAGGLAVEAFMSSVRRVAPTPGAVGVQEGGYMLAGSALGIDAGTALALSLVKRARDLLVALPVILAWQAVQFRRSRHLLENDYDSDVFKEPEGHG